MVRWRFYNAAKNELVHKNAVTQAQYGCCLRQVMGSCENSEADDLYLELKSFNCLAQKRCFRQFCLYSQTIDQNYGSTGFKMLFCFSFLFQRDLGGGQFTGVNGFFTLFLNAKKCVLKTFFWQLQKDHLRFIPNPYSLFIGSINNGRQGCWEE